MKLSDLSLSDLILLHRWLRDWLPNNNKGEYEQGILRYDAIHNEIMRREAELDYGNEGIVKGYFKQESNP